MASRARLGLRAQGSLHRILSFLDSDTSETCLSADAADMTARSIDLMLEIAIYFRAHDVKMKAFRVLRNSGAILFYNSESYPLSIFECQ